MRRTAQRSGSPRHIASLGTALLMVCAVSLQAFAALCNCATCPSRAHAQAKTPACCAAKEGAKSAPNPAIPHMAQPCVCGNADHAQFTAVASAGSVESGGPQHIAALEDVALPHAHPVLRVASNAESPPPAQGITRLNQSFRC